MGKAFADIAFTPSVKEAQSRYGTRQLNRGFENGGDPGDRLGDPEKEFIEARDSFYQATVSETGWPYVQFRGGPAGFLKVLDPSTIAFADFRGNVQYVSVGNINADGRIALILLDYPSRSRLKVWGRARVVHDGDDPALLASLHMAGYRARTERAIVITVEAFDWNCPQHITPRFTEAEVHAATAPLRREIAELRARLSRCDGVSSPDPSTTNRSDET